MFKQRSLILLVLLAAMVLFACTSENPGFGDTRPHVLDGAAADQKAKLDTGKPKLDKPQPPKDIGIPKDKPKPPKDKPKLDKPKPPDMGPDRSLDYGTDTAPDVLWPTDSKICPPPTACTYYLWAGGKCTPVHKPNGTTCNDANPCTVNDKCDGKGKCAGTTTGCKPSTYQSQTCGNCGTQKRQCSSSCTWGAWSLCAGQGVCKNKSQQAQVCGSCGSQTRTCDSTCKWGSWSACSNKGICKPSQIGSQTCGKCGSQSRTCSSKCTWSAWTPCTGEGTCLPKQGQSQVCGNCGIKTRTCGSTCSWGGWGSCIGQGACKPSTKQSQACGTCGTRSRTCDTSCAWGAWSSCASQTGTCTPGTTTPCTGTNACGASASGSKTCSTGCAWGSCVIPKPSKCTLTLYGTIDAYIYKYRPNNNYGMTYYLLSYPHTSREARVYAKFTAPPAGLKGKTILKAQALFRSYNNFGLSVCANAALTTTGSLPKAAWSETTLTWNNRPADGTCSGSSTALSLQKGASWNAGSGARWCVFNIADRLQCWLNGTANHGLVVGSHTLTSGYSTPEAHWYTKGASSSQKPRIYIEYQP